jgi:predicted small lipoprotein YifL
MTRRDLILMLAAATAVTACGKRGAPKPPEDRPAPHPRTYPAPHRDPTVRQ